MTGWNYRIIKHVDNGETWHGIHEVYYGKKKKIEAWSADPIAPVGETTKELKSDLNMMTQAFRAPVLIEVTINGKESLAPLDD